MSARVAGRPPRHRPPKARVGGGGAPSPAVALAVGDVHARPGENPNSMSPDQYEMLVAAIRRFGFLQPILVRPRAAGGHEVVDGHHRLRAARDAGLASVPAVVVTVDDTTSAAEVLSMNRLRGEMSLTLAADVLRDLRDAGFEDLTVTGFTGDEVAALLRATEPAPPAEDEPGGGAQEAAPTEQRRHALRLVFDREADRERVRRVAMSRAPTIEAGILALCEEVEQ